MQSISCNRTWAVYKGMQKYFDHVHVISTSNRHILPRDDVDTSTMSIADAKTIDYRTVFQREGKAAVAKEKTKVSALGRTAAKLQSSFPTIYLFGEGNILYIQNAMRAAEDILKQHAITHIFSTFPPYADHVIAAKLKRNHPELCWIADFRDLHVDPAQDNLFWRTYQKKVNKEILQDADLVTTVSEGLAVHLREFHPWVYVLQNGIWETESIRLPLYPKFTLSYTGSMFQDKRRPETLLAAVKKLIDQGVLHVQDIELVYAGKDGAVWRPLIEHYGLQQVFVDHGLVSHREAEEIQKRSHINILLTYSTNELKGNLTGKLYDYLATRRPVLVVINGPADPEIETLIRETGAGVVLYHNEEERMTNYLAEMFGIWSRTKTLNQEYHEAALQRLTWPVILEKFIRDNAPVFK